MFFLLLDFSANISVLNLFFQKDLRLFLQIIIFKKKLGGFLYEFKKFFRSWFVNYWFCFFTRR
jgi:hypothetical protein